MKSKILFILKEALGYNGTPVPSKGLFNSATFVELGTRGNLIRLHDWNRKALHDWKLFLKS